MDGRLLKTFSLTLVVVAILGGVMITAPVMEEADAVTVYSIVFEPNNGQDSAVTRSVIGGTTVNLPTQLFNNPDMSEGVESFTYLSGWHLGSPTGTLYEAGDPYEITGNVTFYAEYTTVEPIDYRYNNWQDDPYPGEFYRLEMLHATVGEPISFYGGFFESASETEVSDSVQNISPMTETDQSTGAIVPDWLEHQGSQKYTGTPLKPGNYLYQYWFYGVLFGERCINVAILINVPS